VCRVWPPKRDGVPLAWMPDRYSPLLFQPNPVLPSHPGESAVWHSTGERAGNAAAVRIAEPGPKRLLRTFPPPYRSSAASLRDFASLTGRGQGKAGSEDELRKPGNSDRTCDGESEKLRSDFAFKTVPQRVFVPAHRVLAGS